MFKVGDKVKWSDEENGRQKERHGTVVEVVAIRRRPDRNRFPSLYSKSRKHGHDPLYAGGEFRRLACTFPQAVTCDGLCGRNSRRIRSVFGL
jgi:hypothetical protein